MIKAFLSHSSKDKSSYVRLVADKLKNKLSIHYDEYTFEAGNLTLDEIMDSLKKTDLFVFFISDSSLNSEWVKKELLVAEKRLGKGISQFYPVIIDKNITFEDKRIPDWLKQNYNLKYVSKPTISAKRIEQKLRQISLEKHPKLKKKNNLCIGRNKILDEFEERIDDYSKKTPKCIVTSGFPQIGRRTFLKFAMEKTDICKQYYLPYTIYLDINDSIEDFILKINDLGYLDIDSKLHNLLMKSQEYKVQLAVTVLKELQDNNEIVIVLDNGAIINYERKISKWFKDIILSEDLSDKTVICTASKYKVNFSELNSDEFFSIHVDDLSVSERKRLFKRLLEIYEINLSIDDFILISNQFQGFPEQILYTVDFIARTNIENVKDNLHLIREFNDEKASMLIKHYNENEPILSFIRLIAQFEIISLDFLFNIVDSKVFMPILEQLVTENICEYFGYDGQFIRLNDSIRDYIIRNKLEVKEEFKEKVKEHVIDFIKSDNKYEFDSSDFLFSIKEAILNEEIIDETLLFPSHFLRTMKDLYHNRNYTRVIELADKVLEKEDFIDYYLVNDIKYYLCLALAKSREKRVLSEVQRLNGDQHNFILGYYYRIIGKYDLAIERLNRIVNSKYIQARAKREMVHIYIQTEGYSNALTYAKENYLENKNNIYHILLYFTCIIYSDKNQNNKSIAYQLATELEEKSEEIQTDMGRRAQALCVAIYEKNHEKSILLINEAIYAFKDSHYPLLTKFDIATFFNDIKSMKEAIFSLEEFNLNGTISLRTYIKQKAYLLASEGDLSSAIALVNKELKSYPDESKDFILQKLNKLSNK
ncbi:toll/interleukin-1 receptor domain-containing protein [Halarcobacter bivalviorum]|uniref:TIR domain-containing protein n=1 Tax=Halarcobacter bivalviorum TaxID=663364 RepID=A0AAX2AD59_9BACT|nr:toll/interleukin-1 receptor domain-containing protein [Halarcobacter bivalviorum]RXK10676.1 hypothetical protein CRV05_05190 [Halarcobacter bivalviorum]